MFSFFAKMCYNVGMNTSTKTKVIDNKSFSVNTLNKEKIKARSFETMRTSFAIEGIRFTDAELKTLKTSHLQK